MIRIIKSYIPNAIIFHPKMIALGDAFGSPTPLLAIPPLAPSRFVTTRSAELTGKLEATWIGHIAVLRDNHAALRLQSAGEGQTTIALAGWLSPVHGGVPAPGEPAWTAAGDSRYLESPDQDDHDDQIPADLKDPAIRSDSGWIDLLPLDHALIFENSKK